MPNCKVRCKTSTNLKWGVCVIIIFFEKEKRRATEPEREAEANKGKTWGAAKT